MDLTSSLIWGVSDGAKSSPSVGNCSVVKGVGSEWTQMDQKGFGDCWSGVECPLTSTLPFKGVLPWRDGGFEKKKMEC